VLLVALPDRAHELVAPVAAAGQEGLRALHPVLGQRHAGEDDAGVEGGLGDDTLIGLGGADFLWGGEGADRIEGGAHGDRIEGEAGDDEIFAGTRIIPGKS